MDTVGELGAYLRARRERLRPQDVELPPGTRRRVPGLRREEVALLAGISVEYYLRLEQGRDQRPSDQVLDSLARALRLDADAEGYLRTLARPRPPAARRRPTRPERVGPGLRALIDQWTTTPATVVGRSLTTLAANPLAVALNPYFAPGVGTLRAAFLEPGMRAYYRDWETMTAKTVAHLRSMVAGVDDPRVLELIGELSLRSERFRTLWARQDVRVKASGVTLLRHPQVGDLDLHYEKLALPEAPGQMLVTYHAQPGTASYERLHLLAHLAERPEQGARWQEEERAEEGRAATRQPGAGRPGAGRPGARQPEEGARQPELGAPPGDAAPPLR
ncbi:putative DNA-binding protein [Actinacidiphila reveromycinica]|uniref:Putative DNA-binding protein n=1 Tax=Actinacidiphila reveromycinica TaxID=659352 RepID=A0A7U3UPR5_9ACTN|nr:helix-turn-helix transcriptional regulator [Streptomyces sp. SN-593]BBA96456.1 putative DNA-binding protein [Streptomyces sp. SN-593]